MAWQDRLLIIFSIPGAAIALYLGMLVQQQQTELSRLEQKVGHVDDDDPNNLTIVSIHAGEENCFAWRIKAPAKEIELDAAVLGGSRNSFFASSFNSDRLDFIMRTRLLVDKSNNPRVFCELSTGSSFNASPSISAEAMRFLVVHSDKWIIDSPSRETSISKLGDTPIQLLKISIPTELWESTCQLDPNLRSKAPVLLECTLAINDPSFNINTQ